MLVTIGSLPLINSSAKAQQTPSLSIVTGNDFKPFSDRTLPDGGLATEILIEALATQGASSELTWIAWDAGFEASARGEFDGTLPYFFTEERAQTHLYSQPIYSVDRHLFYRNDRLEPPASIDDTEGQEVCLPVGYAISPAMQPLIDDERIIFNQPLDMTRCFELLALGQVDYVVNNPLQGWDLVRELAGLGPDNVSISNFPVEQNALHIIISKARVDAETILAMVDAGLAAIRADGTYDRLVAKHIDLGPGIEDQPAGSLIGITQNVADALASDTAAGVGDTVTLVLNDGSRLLGRIERRSEDGIEIETALGLLNVPASSIAAIEPSDGGTIAVADGAQAPAVPADNVQDARAIILAGSNTIGATLAPRLAELFADNLPGDLVEWRIDGENERTALLEGGGPDSLTRIGIEAHGSSTGFAGLIEGGVDLAMASRPIRDNEAEALANQGDMRSDNAEHVLALDGIAVIVHPDNPLTRLTRAQVASLFGGEIRNWRELDPALPDQPIEIMARDEKSGTFDAFASLVLQDPSALRGDALRFESSIELADRVAITPNALGFTGLSHIRNTRPLIVDECGIDTIPDSFAIKTEEYPFSRRLYLYRPPASSNPWSGPFIELATSDDGQRLAEEEGFISLDITLRDAASSEAFMDGIADRPFQVAATIDDIQKIANGTRRLSTTFRFRTSSANLDARALRDLRRLAAYVRNQNIDPARIILAGFADGRGGYDGNRLLSQQRAQAVADALSAEGLEVGEVYGFSEELPVACDTDERGWALNRRVEIWLKS